jgi:hypothetical protein
MSRFSSAGSQLQIFSKFLYREAFSFESKCCISEYEFEFMTVAARLGVRWRTALVLSEVA